MTSSYSLITSASYANAANAVVNETQFTQISANDASFNDGTGIGNGVIGARAMSQACLTMSDFGFPSSNTVVPTGWTPVITNPNNIAYSDSIGTIPEVATQLKNQVAAFVPPIIYRSEHYINTANPAIANYFYARAMVDVTTNGTSWSVGWGDSVTVAGGINNQIRVYFNTSGNLVLRIMKAGVSVDTTLQTFAVNVFYNILIAWTPATSIAVYVGTGTTLTLITTYITTANFPAVAMVPMLSSLLLNGAGGTATDNLYVSIVTTGRQ